MTTTIAGKVIAVRVGRRWIDCPLDGALKVDTIKDNIIDPIKMVRKSVSEHSPFRVGPRDRDPHRYKRGLTPPI